MGNFPNRPCLYEMVMLMMMTHIISNIHKQYIEHLSIAPGMVKPIASLFEIGHFSDSNFLYFVALRFNVHEHWEHQRKGSVQIDTHIQFGITMCKST